MRFKILCDYIDYCRKNNIEPTFKGLYEWKNTNTN